MKRLRHDDAHGSDDEDLDVTQQQNLAVVEPSPMVCSSHPCINASFSTYTAYESHVLTHHSNICQQCHKRFPSERILELHIEENHNPFHDIKKERGDKVYQCFEAACTKLFSDRRKRRLHLIDKHGYPRNYRFKIVYTGIGKSNSLLE